MSDDKWVKGTKETLVLHERIYALEEKVMFLTSCINKLWPGEDRVSKGRAGIELMECADGEYTYLKPHHLDCGDLGTDCEILDTKPDTVPDPDDIPPE